MIQKLQKEDEKISIPAPNPDICMLNNEIDLLKQQNLSQTSEIRCLMEQLDVSTFI